MSHCPQLYYLIGPLSVYLPRMRMSSLERLYTMVGIEVRSVVKPHALALYIFYIILTCEPLKRLTTDMMCVAGGRFILVVFVNVG